jgi:uncharacterized iron-regulated membrane protein
VNLFLHRPQATRLRALVFRVHLWLGLGVGLYIALIGLTGAIVVFRPELQAAAYPEFHTPDRGPSGSSRNALQNADPATVLREIQASFPDSRVSGIDWPTYRRDTFLAYVSEEGGFRAVFVHPVTGRVQGELPYDWIRWLQDLHFDLLAGTTGRVVNGVGALCLALTCLTGLIVWWPGLTRWRDGLRIHGRRGWKRGTWELHGATGVWLLALLLHWAVTGAYFGFPQPFRSAVGALSPLAAANQPASTVPTALAPITRPAPDAIIARARLEVPGAKVARMVWPFGGRGTFLVVMARRVHGDYDTGDEVTLYFDQYTGDLLLARDHQRRSAGDAVMAWILPLHAGSFGGMPIKILWALAGLALPLLFATGLVMWWTAHHRSP